MCLPGVREAPRALREGRSRMVNALVYHVASGQAFFSGFVLIEQAVLTTFRAGGRWLSLWRTISACAGLLLIAVSATPLPEWFYLVAAVTTLVWIGLEGANWNWSRDSRG
jgi:hypothetical protein